MSSFEEAFYEAVNHTNTNLAFHSSGPISGSAEIKFNLGQVVEVKIFNTNVLGTSVILNEIKHGFRKESLIAPMGSATFRFSVFHEDKVPWHFKVSTTSDVLVGYYEIYTSS